MRIKLNNLMFRLTKRKISLKNFKKKLLSMKQILKKTDLDWKILRKKLKLKRKT